MIEATAIDPDVLWKVAREHWTEIDRDKTLLVFTEMLKVQAPILKRQLSDARVVFTTDTELSLDEQVELCRDLSLFEMESIILKPVGDFVMGYGSRSNLLAVQAVIQSQRHGNSNN